MLWVADSKGPWEGDMMAQTYAWVSWDPHARRTPGTGHVLWKTRCQRDVKLYCVMSICYQ